LFISPFRWLIRNAYGIAGSDVEDCLVGCFLPCCSANQLLQTSQEYGYPPNSGSILNTDKFDNPIASGSILGCCASCVMYPCILGDTLNMAIGMPWWMGCICLNPCSARNIIRYQYRIAGNDVVEELCTPVMFYGSTLILSCISYVFCPCICLTMCPTYTAFVNQIHQETIKRSTPDNRRYLVGYSRGGSFRGSDVGCEANISGSGGGGANSSSNPVLLNTTPGVFQGLVATNYITYDSANK
jgi:hypothetical protein